MSNQPRMIPWSTRRDLVAIKTGGEADAQYAVKDEIRNEFYHFGEVEYFILESMRSPCSIPMLQQGVERRFGIRLSPLEFESYIQNLVRDNLLVAARFGDGDRLYAQAVGQDQQQRLQAFMGLLSIRFRGFHPGNLLRWLAIPGWFLFHPITVVVVSLATLLTVAFAMLSIGTLIQKTPSFQSMAQPSVVALMFLGFIIAKVLHELGHGLACHRAGRECNEMGVMLLVGIPCMFCDVSDVWTQPSRWQRIFVSVAGIYVELIIAVVCFWGWYFSVAGVLHCFLFGLMMVTSINTLFVNGNPLMRYDGYYALADLLNIPNLSQEARNLWQTRIRAWFVNNTPQFKMNQPTWTLTTYAVLASCYRVFIMVAIGWAAWAFFDSQQLQAFGRAAAWLILVLALLPVFMTARSFSQAAWREGLKLTNVTVTVSLLILAYFCLAAIQFDYRIYGEAEIELADAQPLFAPVEGFFTTDVKDGQSVQQGSVVAEIDDPDLRLEVRQLEGEIKEIAARLELLKFSNEPDHAGQLAFWTKRKNSVDLRLIELRSRLNRLNIQAPQNGILVAYRMPATPVKDEAALDTLDGTWFDRVNLGGFVRRGEPLAYVASPENCRGHLKIPESEIEYARVGQTVRLRLPYRNQYVQGKVTSIALESEAETQGGQQPNEPEISFVRVEFDFPTHPSIRIGSSHAVSIQCQPITPLQYLARWWRITFWF